MTIAEAARALGYSVDTVRRGVTKGTGPLGGLLRDAGRRDNSGQWTVSLTPAQITQHKKRLDQDSQHRPATIAAAQASPDDALVQELRRHMARLEADLDRERRDHAADRQRLLDQLDQLDQHQAEHQAERRQLLDMLSDLVRRPGRMEATKPSSRPVAPKPGAEGAAETLSVAGQRQRCGEPSAFLDAVRSALASQGMTAADLAQKTGIPSSTVRGVLAGQQRTSPERRAAIFKTLGLSDQIKALSLFDPRS